jgi:hypothetical protein
MNILVDKSMEKPVQWLEAEGCVPYMTTPISQRNREARGNTWTRNRVILDAAW